MQYNMKFHTNVHTGITVQYKYIPSTKAEKEKPKIEKSTLPLSNVPCSAKGKCI